MEYPGFERYHKRTKLCIFNQSSSDTPAQNNTSDAEETRKYGRYNPVALWDSQALHTGDVMLRERTVEFWVINDSLQKAQ